MTAADSLLTDLHTPKVLQSFQDDRRSSYLCQETDENSPKKFCPFIHCVRAEGELTLYVFTSALDLVAQPYLNSEVMLVYHSAATYILNFIYFPILIHTQTLNAREYDAFIVEGKGGFHAVAIALFNYHWLAIK